jgi:carboxylate-amine ligase
MPLRDHILQTMTQLELHSAALDATEGLALLRTQVEAGQNDARWLREGQAREKLLAEMVRLAALRFRGPSAR